MQAPRSQPFLTHRALPESAQWLLTWGRGEEAKQLIRKVALVNRRKLSSKLLSQILAALGQPCLMGPHRPACLAPHSAHPSQLAPEKTSPAGNALDLFQYPQLWKENLILFYIC